MIEGLKIRSIEQIKEEMIDAYSKGEYIQGTTNWGDDALMSPQKFSERFHDVCLGFGYREAEIIPIKFEIKDWCEEYLKHLESKFI